MSILSLACCCKTRTAHLVCLCLVEMSAAGNWCSFMMTLGEHLVTVVSWIHPCILQGLDFGMQASGRSKGELM